ncbi:MAG: hypothetical protein KAQ67_08790 [Gammaproteobacteria bacterium]|nr:hypothetical protein [Gammaproteobacteria bacterium]
MMLKLKVYHFLVVSIMVFSASQTFAASSKNTLHKFAGFEMGYGTFSFPEKLDHKLVFPVANLTAGLAYKRFSYILNISGSMTDADVSEEEQFGNASRKDYDFTIGYQINKTISVFAGLKEGKTSVTLINRDPLILTGGGDEFYKQSGPYIGANVNWATEGAGKLAFTVSYAALNSDSLFLEDGDGPDVGEPLEFDDAFGRVKGSTNGYSYSLNWTMPIKGSLIFRTRLRINQYKQDIPYTDTKYGYGNVEFKNINESSTMLLVGITSIF